MHQSPTITPEQSAPPSRWENWRAWVAAIVFLAGVIGGAAIVLTRYRQTHGIIVWQDGFPRATTTSGSISVSRFSCPFALDEGESGTLRTTVSNDWSRDLDITVTFHTEDMSSGAPYDYIFTEPLCEETILTLAPGETGSVSCTFEQKVIHQGWMPVAIKARNMAEIVGPNDYDTKACPIWITAVPGLNGQGAIVLFCTLSLLGIVIGGVIWVRVGLFPSDLVDQLPMWIAGLAAVVVWVWIIIAVLPVTVACVLVAAFLAIGLVWWRTYDRRQEPIDSIFKSDT